MCVMEVIVIAILTVSLSFLSIYLGKDCQPVTQYVENPLQVSNIVIKVVQVIWNCLSIFLERDCQPLTQYIEKPLQVR